jgi:glycosyltransferase involved in cell wall biosynthesis
VRILHVTPFYEPYWAYGGMARGSAGLCRALVRRGHEVTVATALLDPGPPREETLEGVRVLRFPGPALLKRLLVPWARGLRDFLRAELPSIDVVHLHGHRNGLAVTAARALRTSGRAWVLQTSGTFPHHGQYPALKALFDRVAGHAVVAGAAELVAVSQCEARDLPRPARVVPNGVESCGAAPATRPREARRILFVGTDRPQKRGQVLPSLLAALPDAELQLVGRFGPRFLGRFAPFAKRTTARGVLAGDALAAAYADADVVVHPAVGEAFGLVPFEAAFAGTAAVVAGGHGCGEWYGRAGGCVVPPDDAAALAEAVRARLNDRGRAQAEARAVVAFARQELTWDKAALAMESVYRDVPGARCPRKRSGS